MKLVKIPFKNRNFEKEQPYLEDKLREGLRLKGRFLFFYIFERTDARHTTVAIDVLPKPLSKSELEVPGWEILDIQRPWFFATQKVIYESSYGQMEIDRQAWRTYYKRRALFPTCFFLTGLVLGAMFMGDLRLITLPPESWLILPPIWIWCFRVFLHDTFMVKDLEDNLGIDPLSLAENGVENQEVQRISIDFDPMKQRYFITIKDFTPEQHQELSQKLEVVGKVVKSMNDFHLVISKLQLEELQEEVMSITGLPREKVRVVCQFRSFKMDMMG